jgi:hypothetical protein
MRMRQVVFGGERMQSTRRMVGCSGALEGRVERAAAANMKYGNGREGH